MSSFECRKSLPIVPQGRTLSLLSVSEPAKHRDRSMAQNGTGIKTVKIVTQGCGDFQCWKHVAVFPPFVGSRVLAKPLGSFPCSKMLSYTNSFRKWAANDVTHEYVNPFLLSSRFRRCFRGAFAWRFFFAGGSPHEPEDRPPSWRF